MINIVKSSIGCSPSLRVNQNKILCIDFFFRFYFLFYCVCTTNPNNFHYNIVIIKMGALLPIYVKKLHFFNRPRTGPHLCVGLVLGSYASSSTPLHFTHINYHLTD